MSIDSSKSMQESARADGFSACTPRLILREAIPSDAEKIATTRNSDFVMRYNLYKKCSAEDVIEEIANYESFVLIEKESNEIIGFVSYRDYDCRRHVISIALQAWLVEEKAYQGYMEEALREIIPYLSKSYKKIVVQIFSANTASIRLAEKLGFEHDKLIKNALKSPAGEIFDLVLMSYKSK